MNECARDYTCWSVPHPIPYQGSKRALPPLILSYFPPRFSRLVEWNERKIAEGEKTV